MKIGAHPLVVAVALGLLGPGALATEDEPEPRPSPALTEADGPLEDLLSRPEAAPEEYARVADEWREARNLL